MNAKRLPALLIAVFLATPAAALAQFQSEGVVYAFTEMRLGQSRQYVLLPVAADTVRPDQPIQSSVPTAFALLRSGKPVSYGNSSITLTDADIAARRVTVNIDPTKVGSFELIAAETVYTFTQLGVERVVFPGVADDGLTREDIDFAAYRFQVPLWQAVAAGPLTACDVIMPDASLQACEDVTAAIADGDEAVGSAVLAYLEQGDRVPAFSVLSGVSALGISGYEAAVVPYLSHEDPAFRDAALRALSTSSDAAAWDAVVEMMRQDAESGLRVSAAQALAASPLESYHVYEVFFRASSPDPAVRIPAIAQLATLDDPRVVAELTGYLADPDPSIALSSVDALAALGAWEPLLTALDDAALAIELRFAAASAIGSGAEGENRLVGLRFRGLALNGPQAITTLEGIDQLDDVEPRAVVEEFLAHPDASIGTRAAQLLAARGDAEALGALEAYASGDPTNPDVLLAVQNAALDLVAAMPSDEIGGLAEDGSSFLKAAAYRALAQQAAAGGGDAEVEAMLIAGLAAGDDSIRAACARALGSLGSEAALAAVLGVSDDPSSEVRAGVALGLGGFAGETFAAQVNPVLISYLQSGEPDVVAGALDALGQLGQVALRPIVIDSMSNGDARVRAAAMRSAVLLVDPANPREVVSGIAGRLRDPEPANRVLAATLLGGFNNDNAVLTLSQVLNEPDRELRFAAIGALGHTGSPGAAGVLVSLLTDPDREVRLAAIAAIEDLAFSSVILDLEAIASRELDPGVVEALGALISYLQANGQ
jgi:HEAT repeat protein